MAKPNLANCPHCGVRFGNTAAGMIANGQDRMNDMQNRNGSNNRNGTAPAAPTQPPVAGNGPNNPGPFVRPAFDNGPATMPTPSSPSSASTSSATGTGRSTTIVLVIFVVGGVLLLLAIAGVGGVVWMISTAPKSSGSDRPVKRRRHNREYEAI